MSDLSRVELYTGELSTLLPFEQRDLVPFDDRFKGAVALWGAFNDVDEKLIQLRLADLFETGRVKMAQENEGSEFSSCIAYAVELEPEVIPDIGTYLCKLALNENHGMRTTDTVKDSLSLWQGKTIDPPANFRISRVNDVAVYMSGQSGHLAPVATVFSLTARKTKV